ncbi:MAG TPA: DUF4296 domain-containing protein [Balneolales bacterium]|nr:DUF4296 domain-containing protein [Balneolales bacterium]
MHHRFYIVSLSLILGLFLVQCSGGPTPPQDLIPPKKYENLLVEFQLLKSYQTMYQDSAKTVELRQKVLKHYHVTLEQFKRSDQFYKLDQSAEHKRLRKALQVLNVARDSIWNVKNHHPKKMSKTEKKIRDRYRKKQKKSKSQSSDK